MTVCVCEYVKDFFSCSFDDSSSVGREKEELWAAEQQEVSVCERSSPSSGCRYTWMKTGFHIPGVWNKQWIFARLESKFYPSDVLLFI